MKYILLIKKQEISDIDRLYLQRKLCGSGVTEIMTAYECRIVSEKQHLTQIQANKK